MRQTGERKICRRGLVWTAGLLLITTPAGLADSVDVTQLELPPVCGVTAATPSGCTAPPRSGGAQPLASTTLSEDVPFDGVAMLQQDTALFRNRELHESTAETQPAEKASGGKGGHDSKPKATHPVEPEATHPIGRPYGSPEQKAAAARLHQRNAATLRAVFVFLGLAVLGVTVYLCVREPRPVGRRRSSAAGAGERFFRTVTAALDTEEEECVNGYGNVPLDQDTFGLCVASIVRDYSVLLRHQGTALLRGSRIISSFALTFSVMTLQIFLLREIYFLCARPAVGGIRDVYDTYEDTMYGNWTTVTAFGGHRGIDGHFNPDAFNQLDFDTQASICNIPFSQPRFFFCVLLIWTLTCIGELKGSLEMFVNLVVRMDTIDSMNDCLIDMTVEDAAANSDDKLIDGLTVWVKAFIGVLLVLPRVCLATFLLWIGCRWLAATNAYADFILNAMGLEFVLLLKDLLYSAIVPARSKKELANTFHRTGSEMQRASFFAYFGTFLWGLAAVVWVYYYTYHFQQVLVGYKWDVRTSCDQWIADNFAE